MKEVRQEMYDASVDTVAIKNNIMTLENYVERYSPIQFIKLMRDLFMHVFDDHMMIKFVKQANEMYFDMQKGITQD